MIRLNPDHLWLPCGCSCTVESTLVQKTGGDGDGSRRLNSKIFAEALAHLVRRGFPWCCKQIIWSATAGPATLYTVPIQVALSKPKSSKRV